MQKIVQNIWDFFIIIIIIIIIFIILHCSVVLTLGLQVQF